MSTNYVTDCTSREDMRSNSFCTSLTWFFRTHDEPTVWMLAVEWLVLPNRGNLVWKDDDRSLKQPHCRAVSVNYFTDCTSWYEDMRTNSFFTSLTGNFRTQQEGPTVWMLAQSGRGELITWVNRKDTPQPRYRKSGRDSAGKMRGWRYDGIKRYSQLNMMCSVGGRRSRN